MNIFTSFPERGTFPLQFLQRHNKVVVRRHRGDRLQIFNILKRLVEKISLYQPADLEVCRGGSFQSAGFERCSANQYFDLAELTAVFLHQFLQRSGPIHRAQLRAAENVIQFCEILINCLCLIRCRVRGIEKIIFFVSSELEGLAPDGIGQFEEVCFLAYFYEIKVKKNRQECDDAGTEEEAEDYLFLE